MSLISTQAEYNWQKAGFREFWSVIAAKKHLVQFYDLEQVFINTLEGFCGSGLLAGEAVILIATPAHTALIMERLHDHGLESEEFIQKGQLVTFDASELLQQFMAFGLPDEEMFLKTIKPVIAETQKKFGTVRAFGEMVALLCAEGNFEGARQLELYWNKICAASDLALFCAYPRGLFGQSHIAHQNNLCNCHGIEISGTNQISTEIQYTSTQFLS
jgi:hypothetical protein